MTHWTSENLNAFIRRVTFDYWTQIQKRMEIVPVTQSELATMFEVSESAVSQTLNNSRNSQMKTLASYAHALQSKFAVVLYEDTDPENGPVNSEIFTLCWEKAGKPHTFGEVRKLPTMTSFASTSGSVLIPKRKGLCLARTTSITNYDALANDLITSNADHLLRIYGGIQEENTASTVIAV